MNLRPWAEPVDDGVQGGRIFTEELVRGRAHVGKPNLDQDRRLLLE
jgi:hypothetical protein